MQDRKEYVFGRNFFLKEMMMISDLCSIFAPINIKRKESLWYHQPSKIVHATRLLPLSASLSVRSTSGNSRQRRYSGEFAKTASELAFVDMNLLDLAYINHLSPYKVWTENGEDYLVETSEGLLFRIGFMDDYSIWPTGAYQFILSRCLCESNRMG